MNEKTADTNTSAHKDLIDDGKSITIGRDRSRVAIDAAAEIEELCSLMRTASKDYDGVDLAIRGLSLRVQDLTSIIVGALSDAVETTPELSYRLTGERGEALAA